MLCSLPLTHYSIQQAKVYGKDRHVIGVHVAQQPDTLAWATAQHDAMCEEWKPIWVNAIDLCDDDDVPPASPAVGSSSQDATRQKRSRPRTDILGMGNNRWGHHDDSGKGKGKGKGKRDASPPAKGGKAGASSKRARKSAASDAALDMDMEKYEEKRVAELKKTYEGLINEHNHQRIANLELIGDAASAGERLVSSHSPVLHLNPKPN